MNSNTVQIDNHVQAALARFMQQYLSINTQYTVYYPLSDITLEVSGVTGLLAAFVDQIQELENESFDVNNGRQLWNGTSGTAFSATYGANSTDDSMGDFHLALNFASATSTGSHYLNVFVQDVTSGIGGYSKTMTFIINKIPAAVTNINNPENNIVLYPNPAHDEVNVVYDQGADVKNIAVYNIIGKVLAVYKVTNNTSANLNLENIPSGIYFVRLINSHGDVVVTRKFTKQ